MNHEDIKGKKQERGYTNLQISQLSGVPLDVVEQYFNGELENPDYDILQALERVLNDQMMLMESTAEYCVTRRPGEYTIEDYYALPDDQRVELIDGYFYTMEGPTTSHQLMAGEIYRQISNFILDKGGSCIPFIAPVDVQLDKDEKTMLQPDVIIVCDKSMMDTHSIVGAPDFVLEVISPSTKRRDYILKLSKYEQAGVKEYWIVDPYQKRVFVYFFENENLPIVYPIDGEIPVNIYEGELVLSFEQIATILSQLEAK